MMKTAVKFLNLFIIVSVLSCKETPKNESKEVLQDTAVVGYDIPESWIQKRVKDASEKLNATEAGKIVWKAMEAHGGLENWYGNGYLSMRFNYMPLDGKGIRDSYQTIDTWNNKARHHSVLDTTATYGWDGNEAWVKAKDSTSFAYDTKFWALTPLYFSGQPFVFDGEGVQLELLEQRTFNDELQDVVKVSYAPGTGAAPDDYYIMYINTKTKLVDAFRYIVSYPEYFPNGGHNPEKITVTQGTTTVDGIVLATGFKTYWTVTDGEPGEYITKIEVSEIKFEPQLKEDYFSKPEGAILVE
ncbi:hypothetical protein MWU65_04295 [Cellulophaga sp. F20128]|uniref:hypothetical protein n=1 Tax=Cellulophaga sp. F20128 TaxID=2926413 RepID=UPI001FF63453|nr:hypothetical protein [Cellulophaga sp. F20128]MCK0156386.1 hypothetical protein [Cellulophaga sp. F20128]